MGTRCRHARQSTMWVATADLPQSAGHPFYERLNRLLDDAGFDACVEARGAPFYAAGIGRPSLAPGWYFRLLLLGYCEGLDPERASGWRPADSLSIRGFRDLELHEPPPDHSTLPRTQRLIDVETHQVGVYVGAAVTGRRAARARVDDRHRCHDARSQRGDAEHCASGHRGELRRVSDVTCAGLRDRDTDPRRTGPV